MNKFIEEKVLRKTSEDFILKNGVARGVHVSMRSTLVLVVTRALCSESGTWVMSQRTSCL